MLRAVLFDLFDTLVDRRAGAGKGPASGAGVPHEIEHEFAMVWDEWGERRTTTSVLYESLLAAAFERAGVEPQPGRIAELAAARSAVKRKQLLDIDADVLELLAACRRMGLTAAVVSGCAMDDVSAWDISPLSEHIEATAFSFEVGCNKPHPDIYLAAIAALGVAPNEAAFVDDMAACLQGARDVGIATTVRAAWFVDRGQGAWSDPVATRPGDVLTHLSVLGHERP